MSHAPLQALIVPDADPRDMMILAGRHLYREGEPLVLCCLDQSWCSLVRLTRVSHYDCLAGSGGIPESAWKDAGYDTLYDLSKSLAEAWNTPVVDSRTEVTVLRWDARAEGVIPESRVSSQTIDEVVKELREEQEQQDVDDED